MEEEWKNGKFTHEMMQELETKQQRSVHGIREGQLTTQHRTELGNQVSFLLQTPFQSCFCEIHERFESTYFICLALP